MAAGVPRRQTAARAPSLAGLLLIGVVAFASVASPLAAQGPKGRSFGLGFAVGEPTGVSFRFWSSRLNSWDLAVGASYLGNPHVQGDYLWHFNEAFSSRVARLYAGVGAALGFGDKGDWVLYRYRHGKVERRWYYDAEDELALVAKGAFGLNILPRNTPLDIFFELNPVIGLNPGFGFDFMPCLGIRFYP